MPTIEELIEQVEQRLGASYGILDVFEGSQVRLQAGFAAVGRGGLFSSSTVEGKWIITTIKAKANPPSTDREVPVRVSRQATEAQHELTLEQVPDTEECYTVRYAFQVKDQRIPGPYEFKVWPQTITLKANITAKSDQERFKFNVSQPGARARKGLLTDTQGNAVINLTVPARAKVSAGSPWKVDAWKEETARKREADVSRQPITAAIFSHRVVGRTKETAHKQWVNEPTDYDRSAGHIVRLSVGAKEDQDAEVPSQRLGQEGQEIFLRVTFPKENSKRNKPKPCLMLDWEEQTEDSPYNPDNPTDRVFSKKVKLGPEGEPAVVQLNMGLSGGDLCKVEVGVTDTYSDDVLWIQNWRRLYLEVVTPHADIRQQSTLLADAALGNAMLGPLKKTLDPAFIELAVQQDTSSVYTEEIINAYLQAKKGKPDLAKCIIHDAAYVKPDGVTVDAGDKVVLWPSMLLYEMRSHLTNEAQKKTAISTRWCDALVSVVPGQSNPSPLSLTFENTTPQEKDLPFHVFKYDPGKADGSFGITGYKWRATDYDDGSGWKKVGLGTPGTTDFLHTWHVMPLATEADINAVVSLVNSKKISVKLPSRLDKKTTDPGHFLSKGGVKFKIQVQLSLSLVEFQPAMAAAKGQIVAGNGFGKGSALEVAGSLVHEIGHNLGLAYIENKGPGAMPGGTDDRGRKAAIPGIPFPKTVHEQGRVFADKGFAGPHCADKLQAMSKEQNKPDALTLAGYDDGYLLGIRDAQPDLFNLHVDMRDADKCLMWAISGSGQAKFCDECLLHAKATDARDVLKDWGK